MEESRESGGIEEFINTKKGFRKLHVLFWDVSDYSSSIFSQKINQHLAMLAIQNQKTLWRKK